jgi:hypothetical protein
MAYSQLRVEPPQARGRPPRAGTPTSFLRHRYCYVDEERLAELPSPDDNELAMLDLAADEVRPNSRLSWRIKASPASEWLVVHLPETQG